MTTKSLYRYVESDKSIIITPSPRSEADEPYAVRLIADAGKQLRCNDICVHSIDTETPSDWVEEDT